MADLRLGDNRLQNFTPLMTLAPRIPNMLERMGVFDVDFTDEDIVAFERIVGGYDEMYSVARGADRQVAGEDQARTALVQLPFFTLDKVIKPKDVHGLRQFLTANDPETVKGKTQQIIARIQKGHAKLHQRAMYQCLKGSTFAVDKDGNARPNLQRTYQSMFEIADADMYKGVAGGAASYNLTTQTQNPADEFELFRKHVVAKAGDEGDNYEIVMLMGSGAFSALTKHNNFREAYSNYASEEEVLRKRLGGLSNNRIFHWQGVTFIEDISGQVANNKGYIFPTGIEDMFQIKYGKSDTIAAANGEEDVKEAYLYVKTEDRREIVETEASLVCVNTRPELVGDYTFTI